MRFGVLGPLEVVAEDGRQVPIPEAKVRALLADLLVNAGTPVSTDRLAQDLWGDRQPRNPTGALQRKIWQLRRALEDAEPGGRDLIVHRSPGYSLRAGPDLLDAARFTALTARARTIEDPRERADLLAEALGLWRGPALADFRDEEFARAAVTRLEEARLTAIEEHAEVRLELGEHGQLAGELAVLVAEFPLRERLRAAHLRALYRAGRKSDALDSYHELRTRLADELGLDPRPELVALHQAILEQDPALDAGPPEPVSAPPSAPAGGATNLPAPLTPLIGRADAVGELRARLADHRLVTLTGPGGVGKTRLAIGAAGELLGDFADGVWIVELAGPGESGELASPADAVAEVLGIRDDIGLGRFPPPEPVSPAKRLADAVCEQNLLLVLDNCEQAVDQIAELAETLLLSAPGLRVLATSRVPLGLAGENLVAVPPLDAPAEPGSAGAAEPESIERFSAVRLFVARAAEAAPGFVLTKENAPAVATLCRRLDGIPLALELAATRVRALGVDGLVARLDDRFRLLSTGHRGSPPRQQTLRAVIDWSWDLLTEPQRAVLRRLAVHKDGCTLEAAESVCSGDDVPAADVPDLLVHLVASSLVVTVDGPRFRLLESVASYCVERLREAGEEDEVRRRHLGYYLGLAERADAGLRGHEQRDWLRRLDTESANLRAALDTAVRRGEPGRALRLTNALGWYWILRGRLREGRRSFATALSVPGAAPGERAVARTWQVGIAVLLGGGSEPLGPLLALLDDIEDAGARARAAWFLGFALLGGGDVTANEGLVGRAAAGFRSAGDRWGLAAALSASAALAVARGDLRTVAGDGTRSLELFGELGDRWGQLRAIDVLATLAEITGDYPAAAGRRREGLAIAEELGLGSDASWQLSGLGRLAMLTGDYAAAEEFHERARRLAIEQSTKAAQHFAELGLGLGARRQGDFATAERHLAGWLDWCDEVSWLPGKALILAELGFIAERRGDAETALARQLEGLAAARASDDPRAVALAVEGVAGAQALHGRHALAARLLGAAGAARERAGAPLPEAERGDVDRITEGLRAALGHDLFETEFERGHEWELKSCLKALFEEGARS